jgi:CHASE2 domain-containing sensor protein
VGVYAVGGLSALERQSIDARFHIRGAEGTSGRVVVVAVDDKMLRRAATRPPIRRIYYARLLDRLRAAHPRLVALDVQFIGRSAHPADDHALLAAMHRTGRVLVATPDSGDGAPPHPAGAARAPGVVAASAGVDPDPDGKLRKMMRAQVALETLPVRAAELLRGQPVDPRAFQRNHAWIDWRGPPGSFPTTSMADVLDGRVPVGAFAGKVVLVGVTAPVAKDVFLTAASTLPMSGVEINANSLETILDDFPLRSAGAAIDLLLLLALACVPVALGLRFSALAVFGGGVLALVLYLGAAQLAFESGQIVAVACPVLALALATAAVIAAHAVIERRQREELERTLAALDVVPRQDAGFFICYRRDHSSYVANSLKTRLSKRVGDARVYLDERSNVAGERWPERIEQEIYSCGVMLVLIGPHWSHAIDRAHGSRLLEDPEDWVRREIETGLQLPHRQAKLVPILHDGASMPDRSELPDSIRPLADWHAFSLTGTQTDAEIDALLDAIRRGGAGVRQRASAGPLDEGPPPANALSRVA